MNTQTRNKLNWTSFHEASDRGKFDVVQLLLHAHGASVNALDEEGGASLHKALQSEIFDIVELLVKWYERQLPGQR